MKYDDPVQDLHINLKKGNQHLNGEQAEQVVRYRSGYANADFDIRKVDIEMASAGGVIPLGRKGNVIEFSEVLAKKILQEEEVKILISLGTGEGKAIAWGCDLTYDYVKINGDYRS